jgi:hypothetical protein
MSQVIPEYVVSKLGPLESVGGDGVAWRLAFQDSAGARRSTDHAQREHARYDRDVPQAHGVRG